MNYYDARQSKLTGRWDFTCKNNDKIWPTGYCAGPKVAEGHPHVDKFHDGGHDTEEEARECYRQYLLDNELRFSDGEGASSQHRCRVCNEFTSGYGELNHALFPLCDKHRTREEVEKLIGPPGLIISSY
jgi:hypothetical protein